MPAPKKASAPSAAAPASTGEKTVTQTAPKSIGGEPNEFDIGIQDLIGEIPGAEFLHAKNAEDSNHVEVENDDPPSAVAKAMADRSDEGTDEVKTRTEQVEEEDESESPNEGEDEAPKSEEGSEQTEEKDGDENETESADAKAKADEEEEEDDDASRHDWPESATKRVGKLTAQKKKLSAEREAAVKERDEAVSKVTDLSAKLEKAQAESMRMPEVADNPLVNAWDAESVQGRIDSALSLKAWCFKNREGGVLKTSEGKEVELTEEQVAENLAACDALISVHAPRRMQYLKELATVNEKARVIYPALFDSSTEDYQYGINALKRIPGLRELPNYAIIIGDAIEGARLRHARAQKAAEEKSTPKAKPSASSPKVPHRKPAVKVPVVQKKVHSSIKNLVEKGGDRQSLENVVESII